MKNPIAKLYEKLTPSELATVALKHLYHGDNDEAGRVALMVPRVHYIGNDLAYMQKVRGFMGMVDDWAALVWKARYQREETFSQALSFVIHPSNDPEGEILCRIKNRLVKWESDLMALDDALESVCASAGVDPDGVRALHGIERFEPLEPSPGEPRTEADMETLGWAIQTLKQCLDRGI